MDDVATRWAEALGAWAIPEELLAAAPAPPFTFSVERFAERADTAVREGLATPTLRRAAALTPAGGTVLDVGCGAGAASLPLGSKAGCLVGVDESEELLTAFAERAPRLGAQAVPIAGRWPDVAADVPVADVVVCSHVVFNVPDLDRFVVALTGHARRAVVLELPQRHPLAWTAPLWRALHGIERPSEPTADDAIEVVRAHGGQPHITRWEQLTRAGRGDADPEDEVVFLRQHLCVGADRDEEIRSALAQTPPPRTREVVTLAWRGTA